MKLGRRATGGISVMPATVMLHCKTHTDIILEKNNNNGMIVLFQ
jgi:hypothetical protein